MEAIQSLFKSVFEFRPFPDLLRSGVMRYAGGKWIEDDGEYDLAFIGYGDSRVPYCLYVEIPFRENLICAWHDDKANCTNPPFSYSHTYYWHYAVCGDIDSYNYEAYNNHENYIASRNGMNKMSLYASCCNGRGVRFEIDDKHIRGGLLRNRDTKEIFKWPDGLACTYCGRTPKLPDGKIREAIARHVALKRLTNNHIGYLMSRDANECDCYYYAMIGNDQQTTTHVDTA